MSLPSSCVTRIALALSLAITLDLSAATPSYDTSSFAQLKFLEGRWKGVGPDGKAFFDEYVMAEAGVMRSIRHADAAFNKPIDGSTVVLKDGAITSTWGAYSWKAVSLTASKACFEPVSAPSAFCWERVGADTVSVTQRWKGADGKEQSYVLTLDRVKP